MTSRLSIGTIPLPIQTAENAILAFMSTRCDVSSQHKLPGLDEIADSWTGRYIGRATVMMIVARLLDEGRLIQYGPYLSDHPIDVL